MNSWDISKSAMFLILSPVIIVYLACFFTVDYLYRLYQDNDEKNTTIIEISAINNEDNENGEAEDYKKNKSLTWENFKVAFSKSYFYIVNLFLVK